MWRRRIGLCMDNLIDRDSFAKQYEKDHQEGKKRET